jgi:Right handed beta helix region
MSRGLLIAACVLALCFDFSAWAASNTKALSTPAAAATTAAPVCPLSGVSITTYGAVGDGKTNNQTAIQNAFNAAALGKKAALIPAGSFAYSGTLTANGIAVCGSGESSILKALDGANEALILTGSGGAIANLQLNGTGTTRLTNPQSAKIWANAAKNYTITNVLINGSSSGGIVNFGSSYGKILNNTIENTLADSIHNTHGSHDVLIKGNLIMNSGDEGIAVVSYVGDGALSHDITATGNTILHNLGSQGLEVSGGSNIIFTDNYVDNTDGYGDIYITSESEWNTLGVNKVLVSGNTFLNGGPNQGTVIIYNSQGSLGYTISGVTVTGNQFLNPKLNAVQLVGNGSATGTLTNNIDYATNDFSTSSDPSMIFTSTDNRVLSPADYNVPLVSPGGGCSFSGCQLHP